MYMYIVHVHVNVNGGPCTVHVLVYTLPTLHLHKCRVGRIEMLAW